jgi:hypothetical protein
MSDAELLLQVESRKKSGIVAALMNLFLFGCGYFYLRKWIYGIFMGGIALTLIIMDMDAAAIGFLIWMFIDGFLEANSYNKKVIEDALKEIRKTPEPTQQQPITPSPNVVNEPKIQINNDSKPVDHAQVSKCYKSFFLLMIVGFILNFFISETEAFIIDTGCACYLAYYWAEALNKNKWLFGALGIIPGVNFITLLVLINHTHKVFKADGVKLGFFGGIKS